MQTNWGDLSTQ